MSAAQTQRIGEPMPGFRLPALDGGGERSLEDVIGKHRGALVIFWSGSCAHCVRYDSYFQRLEHYHPELGFTAIASRVNETREQMMEAMLARHLSFPILVDDGAHTARAWLSQQTPRCYLLDQEGRLLYRGAVDNFKLPGDPEYVEWLEPAIAQYLSGQPIARTETASFGCAIETVYYQIPKFL